MLTLRCTLLRDVFEGAESPDVRTAEWPPSWMRLFAALVSVADPSGADDEILRRLEAARPPRIHASVHTASRRSAFVVTNAATSQPSHTVLPGRTNGERAWSRAVPQTPTVWYQWPANPLALDQTDGLREMCWRIPYFGRSTSPAMIEVVDDAGPESDWLLPLDDGGALDMRVRSPFSGALDALRDAYNEKMSGRGPGDVGDLGIRVGYARPRQIAATPTITGPYHDLVVLRLLGPRLDGRHTARAAGFVRDTLLSRAPEHIAALHGHHGGDVIQVALLGLVDVAHPHADGHLLGVAVAVPSLSTSDMRVLAAALPEPGNHLDVTAGRLGLLRFERLGPVDARPRGLDPDRWTRPSTTWASATPVVLDRHLRRRSDLDAEIRRAVRNARLPEPVRVRAAKAPFIAGGVRMVASDTLRRPTDTDVRPFAHVQLEFADPIRGPVVLGSMRHYGLGLCVPARWDRDE